MSRLRLSTDPVFRKRPKRDGDAVDDPAWIKELRNHSCIFTGQRGNDQESVVPMHVGTHGKGIKTDDEVLPVLNRFHQEGHGGGEVSMIRKHAPDWLLREAFRAYARQYYAEHHGLEGGR